MAMITRIKIRNFQSHRDTEIFPCSGVNILVGRNMSGKSALLRALRLLLYNAPGGSAFVSWGARNADIEIEYGDHKIRRIKGKRANIYEVDGSEFKSFGKGVPDEIVAVLGMFPIRIADSIYELTIEGPHEPPFLVSETDAVKGKIFSELAQHLLGDLVRLDKAISTANVKLRNMNSESSILEEEITVTEEALARFEPIKGTDKKLEMCHGLLSRAQEIQDNLNGLITCRTSLGQIGQDLSICQSLSLVMYDLGDLDSQVEKTRKQQEELISLTQAQAQLTQIGTSLSSLVSRKTVLETIPDVTEAEAEAEKLVSLMQVQSQLTQIDTSLSSLISRKTALETIPDYSEAGSLAIELRSLRVVALELKEIDSSLHELDRDYDKAITELDLAIHDYGELLLEEKRCPICYGPVTEHDAARIIEELTGNGPSGDTEED